MSDDDRPVLTDQELAVALAELTALRLVEWYGDDEARLTSKGIDQALEMRNQLGPSKFVILALFYDQLEAMVSED